MFSWLSKYTKQNKGRVFVGVSGGVDSSVALALLKYQGYDAVGVFIRTWQPDWIECTWRDERRDAMRVCAHVNVPFVELDLEQEYKQGVADYMIREYQAGRTPNPDVMCNKEVKFGGFLSWARKHGGKVATGHYAQIVSHKGSLSLAQGIDISKDQSYFLWTLQQDDLKDILFPVGHLPKSQVRALAKKYGLPTAFKKDSQGICFIGEINMKEFLSHYIEKKSGDVLNIQGETIGYHDGALLYTLGERHGFTITEKTPDDRPYYVIAKNIQENTLTVSHNPHYESKQTCDVVLCDCVWRIIPETQKKYRAQIRYHGDYKTCNIYLENNRYKIIFDEPDYSLSKGQSIVVYDHNVCIGGGIVE